MNDEELGPGYVLFKKTSGHIVTMKKKIYSNLRRSNKILCHWASFDHSLLLVSSSSAGSALVAMKTLNAKAKVAWAQTGWKSTLVWPKGL